MRYPGGKGKSFPQIINCMPPHRVYIETHLGGGAVMRHKKAAQRTIGIDVDPQVVTERGADLGVPCELVCADATSWLKAQQFKGDELIYCDPPYVASTRARQRIYRHELADEQHHALLDVLCSLNCKVILSGYANPLYEAALKGWRSVTFMSKTHAGMREETLWMNFDEPDELHDYSYIGNTFREREAVKRRLTNLKIRIERLAPIERASLAFWLNEQRAFGLETV
ncbi:DNA adenine methylase [uncultured Pseudacidovorax sp.]|uniref:DNA adenine methylase n=1 Tax=uncultured Pseudacidovorax sp. TaxID=679313 RepID=UPI0025FD823C|nr:DNA adenine methylase [uncultured Pseudacidovorax sp.]